MEFMKQSSNLKIYHSTISFFLTLSHFSFQRYRSFITINANHLDLFLKFVQVFPVRVPFIKVSTYRKGGGGK